MRKSKVIEMTPERVKHVYTTVQKILRENGRDPQYLDCNSCLRLEAKVNHYDSRVSFRITPQFEPVYHTEKRLDLWNSYVMAGLEVFFCQPARNNDMFGQPDTLFELRSAFSKQNYGLKALYNSSIDFIIDKRIVGKGLLVRKGLIQVEPMIIFSGNRYTEIELNFPGPLGNKFKNGSRIVLILHGALVYNNF